MISASVNSDQVFKDLNNAVEYALGFLEGAQRGKKIFFEKLGDEIVDIAKEFIDSNARVNPDILHHIYEWYQTGSPEARLFDIHYTISNLGLSFRSTFSQSRSLKAGSKTPFYDKARIMEYGIPVTIRPVSSEVLAFDENGEEVFTKQPVTVSNPGGPMTTGAYQKVFDAFFSSYFSQAFLQSSGILDKLKSPVLFNQNLRAGVRLGRSKGIDTGYRWIANAVVR